MAILSFVWQLRDFECHYEQRALAGRRISRGLALSIRLLGQCNFYFPLARTPSPALRASSLLVCIDFVGLLHARSSLTLIFAEAYAALS